MRYLFLICLACSLVSAQSTKPVEKPKLVTPEEWGSTPQPMADSRKHTPKFITIHHAGTLWTNDKDPVKFVKNMQTWGQNDEQRHWPDVPYHFLIAPDGRIIQGRSTAYEPDSNTKYSLQGHIGVELMGDFNRQRASKEQLQSVVKLVAWLCDDLKIDTSEIATHKDRAVNQTSCPGEAFYRYVSEGLIRRWITETIEGKTPDVQLLPALEKGPTTMISDTTPAATKPAQ